MYRTASPAQSNTSLSDTEDDDFNKSTFFASDPVASTPAQWSSRQQQLAFPLRSIPPQTPTSYASRLPPEILIHILKHLHSSRDIYHALLVSRAWCECSVELLWHRPSFSKLSTLGKMIRIFSRENQTFFYARFIRRLNFLLLGAELTDSLFSRLAQCVRLERLTLINCSSITDAALTRVLPCCPNLVALDLTNVTDTTDRAIVALASSTKRLQGINLGNCKKLTDKGLLALASNCPLLRRVKLSNVDQVTDEAISALAKACPLLLEVDLNNCKRITDSSVRDLWTYSTNMREMRLSYCVELTDSAFPASPRTDVTISIVGPNPFPTSITQFPEKPPPLRLPRPFEHLRMLDLTGCSALTDEAIEGIVSVAPKIRNLVLAKCTQLTDTAVESICQLGKHLHYLHLGHASSITDRSIRSLARACTRLRYIDLANCLQLTDMSVFELSSLQKLRRIGLVRVNNLTDQAIYSLGERHATLERIHLSYCDQITVMAIHFLLQKLPKLTHLSLTGIPAFRRPELQQFRRDPPPEFNPGQIAAFCVYSGKGVTELRQYLSDLFNTITDEINPGSGTEYDEDIDEYRERSNKEDEMEVVDDGEEEDEEEAVPPQNHPTVVVSRGGHGRPSGSQPRQNGSAGTPPNHPSQSTSRHQTMPRELMMTRDRGSHPTARSPNRYTPAQNTSTGTIIAPTQRGRGFGHQPIIETSTSPAPSDVGSNRSAGTNRSSGTAFFRNYGEASTSSLRQGVMTPDLIYAEIGHGRGVGPAGAGPVLVPSPVRRSAEPAYVVGPSNHTIPLGPSAFTAMASAAMVASGSSTQLQNPFVGPTDGERRRSRINHANKRREDSSAPASASSSEGNGHGNPMADSYQRSPPISDLSESWSTVQHEDAMVSRSQSVSPTTRELQESVESALGHQSGGYTEVDGRGRSGKRVSRNPATAAEQYASSFFFARGSNGSVHESAGGPSNSRDSDSHGH